MSLLAIVYHLVPEAPILVAYNREERFDRVCPAPSIQPGKPRVLASVDQQTGGSHLGINPVSYTHLTLPTILLV